MTNFSHYAQELTNGDHNDFNYSSNASDSEIFKSLRDMLYDGYQEDDVTVMHNYLYENIKSISQNGVNNDRVSNSDFMFSKFVAESDSQEFELVKNEKLADVADMTGIRNASSNNAPPRKLSTNNDIQNSPINS
jgi:hypothetical protein